MQNPFAHPPDWRANTVLCLRCRKKDRKKGKRKKENCQGKSLWTSSSHNTSKSGHQGSSWASPTSHTLLPPYQGLISFSLPRHDSANQLPALIWRWFQSSEGTPRSRSNILFFVVTACIFPSHAAPSETRMHPLEYQHLNTSNLVISPINSTSM